VTRSLLLLPHAVGSESSGGQLRNLLIQEVLRDLGSLSIVEHATRTATAPIGEWDLVWYASFETIRRGPRLTGSPLVVLDAYDIPHSYQWRYAKFMLRNGRPMTAAKALVQATRWAFIEQVLARRATDVVVCSEVDARRVRRASFVLPNFYETGLPERGHRTPDGGRFVIAMQGMFTYEPNYYAARRLVERIAPIARGAIPDLEVRLVGRCDTRVQQLGERDGVTVTGYVERIADHLADVDVLVVPLEIGSGTRVKILEAMSFGIPVVSTTVGAEGLGLVDGRHILVRDSHREIAEAIVALSRDPAMGARLATESRNELVTRFSTDAAKGRLREWLEIKLRRARDGPPMLGPA
jgi:glycosyltransferase involved in cell wall biosynthesis